MLGSPNTVLKGPLLGHGSCCQHSEQTLFCRVGTPWPPLLHSPQVLAAGEPPADPPRGRRGAGLSAEPMSVCCCGQGCGAGGVNATPSFGKGRALTSPQESCKQIASSFLS